MEVTLDDITSFPMAIGPMGEDAKRIVLLFVLCLLLALLLLLNKLEGGVEEEEAPSIVWRAVWRGWFCPEGTKVAVVEWQEEARCGLLADIDADESCRARRSVAALPTLPDSVGATVMVKARNLKAKESENQF